MALSRMPQKPATHWKRLTLERTQTLDRFSSNALALASLFGSRPTLLFPRLCARQLDSYPGITATHAMIRCRGRQRPREGMNTSLKPPYSHPASYFSPSKHLPLSQQLRNGDLRSSCKHVNCKRDGQIRDIQTRFPYTLCLSTRLTPHRPIGPPLSNKEMPHVLERPEDTKWRHKNIPKIGTAVSGGGNRTAQYDNNAGRLLQIASYLLSHSGSSRLTDSLYENDSQTLSDLDEDNTITWLLNLNKSDNDNTSSDQVDQLWSRISMIPSWSQHLDTLPIVQAKPWLVDSDLSVSPVPSLFTELAVEGHERSYATSMNLDTAFPRATIDRRKLRIWIPSSHPVPSPSSTNPRPQSYDEASYNASCLYYDKAPTWREIPHLRRAWRYIDHHRMPVRRTDSVDSDMHGPPPIIPAIRLSPFRPLPPSDLTCTDISAQIIPFSLLKSRHLCSFPLPTPRTLERFPSDTHSPTSLTPHRALCDVVPSSRTTLMEEQQTVKH
ncbi:hypothetical protein EDB87DRAFT_1624934 [Lactarius vividus]|nr:hypothetical protein EDB87DRAFT_1624934 [Lactarius vividus]